jgi:hypothetical protein
MNSEEIKHDLQKQIAKTNRSFKYLWEVLDTDDENIKSLERILKKVSLQFKVGKIMSIPLSCLLFVIPIIKGFSDTMFFDLNKGSLLPMFTVVFLLNTYRSYKIKVNLENKIYLLKLLNNIDQV